ncbi:hypothetical protein ACH4GE_34420 [Streptomyces tendae]|uniref:hypothetical protein n=1 Tax=Streptomyces tendae TaxID=1932 RepID=UPI0037901E66
MPYLIPSRTPLTPDQVERGSDYLLALQMGGGAAVAGRAEADPELAFILLRLAKDIVWPVTAVDGEADLCAASFAVDEVGCVLLSVLRDSPTTAALGIARSIIRFMVNLILDPDHEDTANTLEALRDARLTVAHAVHSVPGAHRCSGAHRVHPVRTTVHPVRLHSVGGARTGWARCAGVGPSGDGVFLLDLRRGQGETRRVDTRPHSRRCRPLPLRALHSVSSTRWSGC